VIPLRDKSTFEYYRFLDEVIAEIGLISSVINSAKDFSYLSGVETDLKDVISTSLRIYSGKKKKTRKEDLILKGNILKAFHFIKSTFSGM
jgi:hypothetical protein